MATEKEVQEFVHTLEEGVWSKWLKVAVLLAALAALTFIVLTKFRGLAAPEGMEQAEIAREIASGHGFSTKMIRPMELWQLLQNDRGYPTGDIPDTFHAPLNPWVNSFFLKMARDSWAMAPTDVVYLCDYVIAEVSIGFFLLAILMGYLTARRLFDHRLAIVGVGLIALCNAFWQFALSGLPQMLMLFLFNACLYVLVRAFQTAESDGLVAPWFAAAGALFGLLALTHGLTIWIFAAAFFYTALAFRPRGRDALLMLAIFCLVYCPWLVRNHRVCGDAMGLGFYAILDGLVRSGGEWMRSMKPSFVEIGPGVVLNKLQTQILSQADRIYGLLGESIVAPLFFVSLMHQFKSAVIGSFRWLLFVMALGALLGMGLFGVPDTSPVEANDLYILFVPIMIFYGLAFFLALWTRLEVAHDWMRVALLCLVYVVSGFPLVNALRERAGAYHWPPYIPPVISIFNAWTDTDEIMVSDMPWAVAWYADRKCLWLPGTAEDFLDLSDYSRLGSPIVGLFLTPVTGNARFRADLGFGEYRGWRRLILGYPPPPRFPLQYSQALPVNGECVFIADRPRWLEKKRPKK